MEKNKHKRKRTLTAFLARFMVTEDYQGTVDDIERLYGFKKEQETVKNGSNKNY